MLSNARGARDTELRQGAGIIALVGLVEKGNFRENATKVKELRRLASGAAYFLSRLKRNVCGGCTCDGFSGLIS
jgi:hypothetical protein